MELTRAFHVIRCHTIVTLISPLFYSPSPPSFLTKKVFLLARAILYENDRLSSSKHIQLNIFKVRMSEADTMVKLIPTARVKTSKESYP